MPPTLVSVAVGALLAVALLGAAFDRRALAVVVTAAALPDLDAVTALLVPGLTNALLHTAFLPALAAGLVGYDTLVRERSWLRGRYGWRGVRVAWVALAALAVAGVGLDLFGGEGAAILYPLSDRFYAVDGRLVLSTESGIVQTYVEVADGWIVVDSPGTTATHRVGSPLVAVEGEHRLRLVETGWQAIVVLAAPLAVLAKARLARGGR